MPTSSARSTRRRSRRSSTAAAPPRSKARSRSTTSSIPVGSERAGEIIVESGQKITKNVAETICTSGVKQVEVMDAAEDAAVAQRAGRRRHVQPRRSAAADLPAAASGQSAAAGKGQRAVPRKVLRREPLSPGPRRPLPHQSQVEPERAGRRNDAAAGRLDQRDQVLDEAA